MKHEMKWITVWILTNLGVGILSLLYLYLTEGLGLYGVWTVSVFLLSIVLPYGVWKYNQVKFVEKRMIKIQILND